jgi:hypothetical protein
MATDKTDIDPKTGLPRVAAAPIATPPAAAAPAATAPIAVPTTTQPTATSTATTEAIKAYADYNANPQKQVVGAVAKPTVTPEAIKAFADYNATNISTLPAVIKPEPNAIATQPIAESSFKLPELPNVEKTGIIGATKNIATLSPRVIGEGIGQGVAAAQTAIETPGVQKLLFGTDGMKSSSPIASPTAKPEAEPTTGMITPVSVPATAAQIATETEKAAKVGAVAPVVTAPTLTERPDLGSNVSKIIDAQGRATYTNLGVAGYREQANQTNQAKNLALLPDHSTTAGIGALENNEMAAVQAARPKGTSSGNFTGDYLASNTSGNTESTPTQQIASAPQRVTLPIATQTQASAPQQAVTASAAPTVTASQVSGNTNASGTNFGTGDKYQAPPLDVNGKYIAAAPIATETPIAAAPSVGYQQAPIQSNVLPDRFANEQMQRNIVNAQNAVAAGMADPSNAQARYSAKIGAKNLEDLMGYDVSGKIKTQQAEQELGQKDLSQRRGENMEGYKALLGNSVENKKLAQRGQESEQQAAQFGQSKAQQASQFGQGQALAEKRLAMESQPRAGKLVSEDIIDAEGNPTGAKRLVNEITGVPIEETRAQQKAQQAEMSSKQAHIAALKQQGKDTSALETHFNNQYGKR